MLNPFLLKILNSFSLFFFESGPDMFSKQFKPSSLHKAIFRLPISLARRSRGRNKLIHTNPRCCSYPWLHQIQDYLFLPIHCLYQKVKTYRHDISLSSLFFNGCHRLKIFDGFLVAVL